MRLDSTHILKLWCDHRMDTLAIAKRLGVPESAVANILYHWRKNPVGPLTRGKSALRMALINAQA